MIWIRMAVAALALAGEAQGTALDKPAEPLVAEAAVPEAIEQVDALLTGAVQQGFGGAVIIQRGEEVLLANGYGFADREARVPFTTSSVAQIGSITKSQTGAAIAVLIANGKIGLNEPVGRYIPEAPEPGRSRTIGQLLAHRSGLLDACGDDFEPMSEAKLVSDCLGRPLAHPVGEDHYSNSGYSVLALIVQRVTGRPWDEAVGELVWRPIGLEDIGFTFADRPEMSFARGYLNDKPQPVISRSIANLDGSDWALRGNGGLQASPETMIAFLNGLLDRPGGLDEKSRALLLAPVPGQSGEVRQGYGLAFRYDDRGKLVRMGHAGSDGVFFSYLGWIAANDVRLYFVGNNGEPAVRPLLQQVLKRVLALPPRR